MKITEINKKDNAITIVLDNKETAIFYPFCKSIFTTTSENLLKKDLAEFKRDIVKCGWDIEKLKTNWI